MYDLACRVLGLGVSVSGLRGFRVFLRAWGFHDLGYGPWKDF